MKPQRRIARVVTVPPLAPGFVGPGHLAAQVVSPGDFLLNDPFIVLMDDHFDIGDRTVGEPHPHAGFETVTLLLDGAINALGKVGLMLNVHKDNLAAVVQVLPALKRPTVSHLSDSEWLAVNTILDESTVRTIIPRLKQAGAEGIVEYPLNKIVM